MKKIIFIGDFLYRSPEYLINKSLWLQQIFEPIIKDILNENVDITYGLKDEKGNLFSRKYFYALGGIKNLSDESQNYDISQFNKEQIDYIKDFFDENTILISFELYSKLSDFLSQFGCTIIDFAFHPYKLFDDLTYGIYTNHNKIYEQLLKYKIPQKKFYYYANYWKIFMQQNMMVQDEDLDNNSALFIGQTLIDKSVAKNGKFLNVTDYEDRLKELKEKYSKIYYLPHPYLGKARKFIYDWVKKSPYIELIDNRSTYGLLASDKIKKVVGISTSVLYEAQYFNKEIEYLYQPLFNVDTSFNEHSYISILDDYFNPKFWADVLSPILNVNCDIEDINYFKPLHNKIRNIQNQYWGYAQLDPIKRVPNFEQSIRNTFLKHIAPHIKKGK